MKNSLPISSLSYKANDSKIKNKVSFASDENSLIEMQLL